jgi:hypothetical protein
LTLISSRITEEITMIRRAFLAFLFFGLVACGDDGQGPEPIACTDDTGSVEVTVTTGASVRFDWEPACAVALLIVEQEASDRWLIGTAIVDEPLLAELRENIITPPVTYGVTPSGVDELQPPETLVAGVTYELILRRVFPENSTAVCQVNACLLAVHEFVR